MTLVADVEKLSRTVEVLSEQEAATSKLALSHEQQISGDRGINETLIDVANEIRALRRAAYWVAGIIIIGAVTFAFSALSLVGHG